MKKYKYSFGFAIHNFSCCTLSLVKCISLSLSVSFIRVHFSFMGLTFKKMVFSFCYVFIFDLNMFRWLMKRDLMSVAMDDV